MARLGIMGDAVQEFVGPGTDMVIDEMRQRAVNPEGAKPQRNQDQAGPEQHGLGCRAEAAKSTGMVSHAASRHTGQPCIYQRIGRSAGFWRCCCLRLRPWVRATPGP